MSRVVVVLGSARREGNTELLAQAFARGARAAGHEVEFVWAAELHIAPCTGCNVCRRAPDGQCCIQDDMQECCARLAGAEMLVFATPVYFYGPSAQLKALVDRLHAPVRRTFRARTLGLLAVCADAQEETFDAVKAMYKATLRYFSLRDGGIVTACGVEKKGEIAGHAALAAAEEMGRRIR